MRRLKRPALLLLLVAVVTLPAIADKAKDLYSKGEDAEARQNFEAAYGFFKQAYDLKPKDLRYRASFERIRFEAAASIVHQGQKLRDDGKLDEAVAEFQKAVQLSGGSPTSIANLARAYVASGKRSEAEKLLTDLKKRSTTGYSHASEIAVIYAALGDTDQAMTWLEKGYEERFNPGVLLRPGFDPLRSNPRFQDLASRVGLPR